MKAGICACGTDAASTGGTLVNGLVWMCTACLAKEYAVMQDARRAAQERGRAASAARAFLLARATSM